MRLVKKCGQVEGSNSAAVTMVAPPTRALAPTAIAGRERGQEDPLATLIRFRRAFAIAYVAWGSFIGVDYFVVHALNAGRFSHFVIPRLALLVVFAPVLALLYSRSPKAPPITKRVLTAIDLAAFTGTAIALALMCVEFHGLASPYIPGFCLHLAARTVSVRDDPWRRGVVVNGIPVASFFAVLLASSFFSPRIAAQLHDPTSVATALLYGSYVIVAWMWLVAGSHLTWALRKQIFEARNLGQYRLKRRIASGGMGEVWFAYHPVLKRDVAVKILKPEEQERSASALARFEREVRATAELVHPNTVRVFDYGVTDDGLWYYVMELLQGETLAEHVGRLGPLPPARAIHVVGQAARALAEAHSHGIVHRDIKPENLFLTSLGGEHDFVKVIDFGIAKVEDVDNNMTGTGWVMGTPAYMSPEVAMGQPADARSDVYALGEVLYFLLCGKPPFQADNITALLYAQVNERVISPSRVLGRQLPTDVEAVVTRALQKAPGDRYQTAAEFALALASCTLAGKWTFGDAALVARNSSRPPPPGGLDALPSLRAPRVPNLPGLEVDFPAIQSAPPEEGSNDVAPSHRALRAEADKGADPQVMMPAKAS